MSPPAAPLPKPPQPVPFGEATRLWLRIGWLSFGGPAAQIALMHREIVERRAWLSEPRFLHALNYCMLLPGPEAQQLAIYIGWLLHRTWGGIVAGTLFVLPGFLTILALSALYVGLQEFPPFDAVFFGLKAVVLAIVAQAVVRIGRRALQGPFAIGIAAAAFIAIHFFEVPFPWIVFSAALVGLLAGRIAPRAMPAAAPTTRSTSSESLVDRLLAAGQLHHTRPSTRRALLVLLSCGSLWALPVLAAFALLGPEHVLTREGIFFSQTAVVTFGGAYAVLAYVAQRAVEDFGWLQPGEMLDGLALAETTPGPLILVVQFVGFLGAFRLAEPLDPWTAALLGAALTAWVTFLPCFLFIFLGAPYVETLSRSGTLSTALAAITAAVVGVILNLSVWFATRTLFDTVDTRYVGPVRLDVPLWSSVEPGAVVLAAAALFAVLRWRIGLGWILSGGALTGSLYWLWKNGHIG